MKRDNDSTVSIFGVGQERGRPDRHPGPRGAGPEPQLQPANGLGRTGLRVYEPPVERSRSARPASCCGAPAIPGTAFSLQSTASSRC